MTPRTLTTYTPSPSAPAGALLYRAPITAVRVVRDRSASAPYQIKSPSDVAATLRELVAEADREVLAAVLLDTKNRILAIDPVAVGSLDAALVCMRELFKTALLLGAAALILTHNHPSCVTTPSPEDELITANAIQAGKLLGIDVLDHIILGSDGGSTSLRQRGGAYWK